MKYIQYILTTLAIFIFLILASDSVLAQDGTITPTPTTPVVATCVLPTTCQVNKTTPHGIESFPCWEGTEPIFSTPEQSSGLTYNAITIDDTGGVGGEDCGGGTCRNDVILENPDPNSQVKGLWWRMHDHEEGLRYNLQACRTALVNGTCASWETLRQGVSVDTSGDGREDCSDNVNRNHPPGDQGCPDPLPDPKTCHQSADRGNWPCAMSMDEHTWSAASCAPQNITAFRVVFTDDDTHAHLADAIWILDAQSCKIQGSNPGATTTLKNAAGVVLQTVTTDTYSFTNLPAGVNYTVETNGTSIGGSTLCLNSTTCHTPPNSTNNAWVAGKTRNVTNCPSNGFVDLHWHTGDVAGPLTGALTGPTTITIDDGGAGTGTYTATLTNPPAGNYTLQIFRSPLAQQNWRQIGTDIACTGGTCTGTAVWDLGNFADQPGDYYVMLKAKNNTTNFTCSGNFKQCTTAATGKCDLWDGALAATENDCGPSDLITVRVARGAEAPYCTQAAAITLSDSPATDAGKIIFKIKFQGVDLANIAAETSKTQHVKVSVIKQLADVTSGLGLQTITSKTFSDVEVKTTGEKDANGIAIWQGEFTPTAIVPGTSYSMLIKGPFHLQRKFCENNPTERAEEGFPYTCTIVGKIALTAAENRLDFSQVLLQAGDLPGSHGQDGVVNAIDVSLVLNMIRNGFSRDAADLKVADMDYNGVVNAKDRSYLVETLEEKYGDEEPRP